MSIIEKKRFMIVTLGCRANHYEAEALASMLESKGALYCGSVDDSPHIILIVTCSITSVADTKTRKILRKLRRNCPSAVVVACGCYAQDVSVSEAASLGIDILVGNRMKSEIPEALEQWFSEERHFIEIREDIGRSGKWDALALDYPRIHTRAFVKVQDGCNMRCSYCIVPRLRGAQVSRDPKEVEREIRTIVSGDCMEVVLTGVHLGSYKHEGVSLAGLIGIASGIPGLARLRLGSLEPFAIDDALLKAFSESSVFCPHLHLPLQSGDDAVLQRMRRGYRATDFARTIEKIRAVLGEDVHISTDLIVGFPGETDEAFENSLKLISELALGKIHVFPFSPRRGTDAAVFEDKVPRHVVRERMRTALALSGRLLDDYASRWVGRDIPILIEETGCDTVSGWSPHYIKAYGKPEAGRKEGMVVSINAKNRVRGILLEDGTMSDKIGDLSENDD